MLYMMCLTRSRDLRWLVIHIVPFYLHFYNGANPHTRIHTLCIRRRPAVHLSFVCIGRALRCPLIIELSFFRFVLARRVHKLFYKMIKNCTHKFTQPTRTNDDDTAGDTRGRTSTIERSTRRDLGTQSLRRRCVPFRSKVTLFSRAVMPE